MPPPRDDAAPDPFDASGANWSAAPEGDATVGVTWHDAGDDAPSDVSAGRYVVGPLLGQGGMGRVFAATDLRLDREVALKEALPGTEARLAREARVTARLDHPNIVPVHDVGRSADGRSFYAMRLVRGRSLAAALAEHAGSGPTAAAARLRHVRTLLAVAEAVAFAHARGVVHRDLKPANVLVGEFGETQVMDWGIADAPGARAGGVVGTPRYMAPEQARGEPVDARADVWSLGAMLHELLVGAPPFSGPAEDVLAAARAGVVPPIRTRAPDAPAELAAIAERALHADPAGRYPTALALAADLEAWLDGRRVQAHTYTPRELFGRLVRAWRVPLGVGAIAAAVLAVGAAGATVRVVAERDRARTAEVATAGALAEAEESLARALVARALTALEGDDASAAELAAARALTLRESAEARGVLAAFAIGERPRLVSRRPAPACEVVRFGEDPRLVWCDDAAGHGVWDTASGAWRWRAEGGAAWVGDRVYAWKTPADFDAPTVLDLATGEPLGIPAPTLGGAVLAVTAAGEALLGDMGAVRILAPGAAATPVVGTCPDGARPQAARADARWQVVACYDGTLLVWDGARTAAPRVLPPVMASPTALGIVGDTLVVGNGGGAMRVVDLSTGETGAAGDSGLGPVRAIEPWPGGPGVAVLGDRGVGWWDTGAGTLHVRLAARNPRAIRAVEGGLWVLGDALERWSTPAAPPARVLRSPNGVGGVAVDAAGERLLAYGGGGDVRVFSVADGALLGDHRVQDGVTKAAAFGPDGGVVAVAASPPGLVWHPDGATDGGAVAPAPFRDERFKRVFALRDGWTALFGYADEAVFVRWGGDAAAARARFGGHLLDAALTPGGAWGVALDERGGVHRIEGDPPTARLLFTDPTPGAIAVAADGRVVVASSDEVRVYDAGGARLATFAAAGLRDVAVSPDGRWVAAGSAGGLTYVWDADAAVLRAVLHGHGARVQGVAFSPDGRWLATGSWDGTTRRWGLDVLDAAPAALQAALEAAWGRTLEDVEGA